MAPVTTTELTNYLNTTVTVAPLVLLSAVDHYERAISSTSNTSAIPNKRVVGVILGDNSSDKQSIKVTNSFAIPFEEDEKNPDIWFLDHNYIESMLEMTKKINAKEKLIGWYHSGPKLKSSDLQINEMFKKFTPNPLLLIVDVNSNDQIDIPTDSYLAIEEIKDDGSSSEKTFIHLPSIIKAEEAEEIGVEHLLRDIRDQACGNLSIRLTNNFKSLRSLSERLINIVNYLNKIISNELPINNVILGKLQDIFNLLPNLTGLTNTALSSSPSQSTTGKSTSDNGIEITNKANQLSSAFNIKTNDELMVLYISSLVRSIIAFHDLIENKISNNQLAHAASSKADDSTESAVGESDSKKDEDSDKKE